MVSAIKVKSNVLHHPVLMGFLIPGFLRSRPTSRPALSAEYD